WRPERSKTAAASQSHTPRRAAPGGPIRSLAYAVGGAAGPRAFARELTCPRIIAVAHLPEPSQLVPKTAVLPWNNSVRTYVSICVPADNHQAGPGSERDIQPCAPSQNGPARFDRSGRVVSFKQLAGESVAMSNV